MADLRAFFDALKTENLRYSVLRNHEGLPLYWGNDVDILVHPDDLTTATRLLFRVFDLVDVPHRRMRRFHFLSYCFPLRERSLQVDFYTAISKAWFQYADAEFVLARSQENEAGILVPHPSDEVRLIAAKELFSYGYLREKYHALFRENVIVEDTQKDALFSGRLNPASIALIERCVADPDTCGRPRPTLHALAAPIDFFRWMCLRGSRFQKDESNV